MSQYRIINIWQRTVEIIDCIQEGASLIRKQRKVKKNIKVTRTKWIQSILKTRFEFM